MKTTVYLDNAATTFPKPQTVLSQVTDIIRYRCGNPGRSGHKISMLAAEEVYNCRKAIADEFGGVEENTVFVSSATHALNLGIKTALHRGDHVLISDIEHNSVIRPISTLSERGLISYDVYSANSETNAVISELSAKLRPNTAMVIACHHSNICNLVQPIGEIGAFCRKHGIIFLVDAAQSAGVLRLDIENDKIDILCAPGHKGLYGLTGSGFALFGNRYSGDNAKKLGTLIEGGNGILSREPFMPDFLPDRLEAGTLALPAIGALYAGISFVRARGKQNILEKECSLYRQLKRGLNTLNSHLELYGDNSEGGILLFSVHGFRSEEFASMLDRHGICVRAGLHCAPSAHTKLGTPSDGAVRVSFGAFNTQSDVDRLLNATEDIIHSEKQR